MTEEKLATDAVTPDKIPNRTRRVMFDTRADGGGGVVESNIEGSPEVSYSGTPTQFARGRVMVPRDYASGDVVIHLITRATNSATHNGEYFIGCRATNASFSVWNIANAQALSSIVFTSNVMKDVTMATIPAANVGAGYLLTFAFRISTAITGTVFLNAAELEYTADS